MFWALDAVRAEHLLMLAKEKELKPFSQEQMDSWVQNVKDCHKVEKYSLLRRIATLKMLVSSQVRRAESSTEHVQPESASATDGHDGSINT